MTTWNMRRAIEAFAKDRKGTVAMVFSLSFIPVVALIGVGVDYGRGIALGAKVQSVVDEANLASTSLTGDARQAFVTNAINASFADDELATAKPLTPTFSTAASGAYTVTLTVSIATNIIKAAWPSFATMSTTKSSSVLAGVPGTAGTPGTIGATDASCIFTTGEMLALSTNVLTFNGSPSVVLSGCNIRSNKSITCNGGNIGANHAYAVGSIGGNCTTSATYQHPGSAMLPDQYSSIASNITFLCGADSAGVTWTTSTAGALPTGTHVKTATQTGYTEIHICGNLRLQGTTGSLTGSAPTSDTVVVIENGGLDLTTSDINVTAKRMTFVLASGITNNSANYPVVQWPNGNGHAATLHLSSSTSSANPFVGMAIYQNPSLAFNSIEDNAWKPGGALYFDGIIYLPNALLTVSGNLYFGDVGCTKIVAGEFTLNGNVSLKQSTAACATMGVSQYTWDGSPGTPAVAATYTRLTSN